MDQKIRHEAGLEAALVRLRKENSVKHRNKVILSLGPQTILVIIN